ncbi:hypothetical protein, partial [Klebsiella pneumoniae]|uniref:hypothetical protein n=1 Tax=Klebsiella pneumoniae TaxID=573 RepID=UPI001D0DE823
VGNLVLRKNEASRQTSGRKLDANWEGPHLVVKDNGNGSFKLEDGEGRTLARTWNATNLKRFYP